MKVIGEFGITGKGAIFNDTKVIGVVRRDCLEIEGYKEMDFDEFLEKHADEYPMNALMDAGLILRGLGEELEFCVVKYCEGLPVVFDPKWTDFVVVVAPKVSRKCSPSPLRI